MSLNRTLRLAGANVHSVRYGSLSNSFICNRTQAAATVQPSTSTSPFAKKEPYALSPIPATATSRRSFTTSSKRQAASNENENGDEDPRTAINTERSEYTRSGTDSSVASQKSAWDVSHNTPERARQASDEESERDGKGKWGPLEISPANQEVSKSTDESGRGESVVHGPSKRISPRKGKKVTYGGQAIPPGSEQASSKE